MTFAAYTSPDNEQDEARDNMDGWMNGWMNVIKCIPVLTWCIKWCNTGHITHGAQKNSPRGTKAFLYDGDEHTL